MRVFPEKNQDRGRISRGCGFGSAVRCLGLAGLILTGLYLAGCSHEPVKIGFVGTLMGRLSEPSIALRNGVIFAVEEVNRTGGIHGRPVELLIRDDKRDRSAVVKIGRELMEQGIVALIGPDGSFAEEALAQLSRTNKLFISTGPANAGSIHRSQSYIGLFPPYAEGARLQAGYAFQELKLKKMAVLYDLSNPTDYTDWLRCFRESFHVMGGQVTATIAFESSGSLNMSDLVVKLLQSNPDGILLIAGGLDAALLCQQIRKYSGSLPVMVAPWALTPTFLECGGPAVEGVTGVHCVGGPVRSGVRRADRSGFRERFGEDPGLGTILGYEAAWLAFETMIDNPELLKTQNHTGGIGTSAVGDIAARFNGLNRVYHLLRVRYGKLERINR
jgi:branched-chain amino acid transport system substrate-binding protein